MKGDKKPSWLGREALKATAVVDDWTQMLFFTESPFVLYSSPKVNLIFIQRSHHLLERTRDG